MAIRNFKHRGLMQFFEKQDGRKLPQSHLGQIARILEEIDQATVPTDIGRGRLHPLKGGLKGYWSIRVTGNWRIIFRFENGNAYDVDLIDYH